jgi:sulfide dehydrogenase [flavocytochrome c] flavoprotein subunit
MKRRYFLLAGAASWAATSLPGCGGGGSSTDGESAPDDTMSGSSTPTAAPVPTVAGVGGRVVVIGGGMAGATVAKYLRLWGGTELQVTLVERAAAYTSCIMSSLVLTGQRSLTDLSFGYEALRARYGVNTVFDDVVAVDPVAPSVTLASGRTLVADRIVLAPGIEFDAVAGLTDSNAMPHAWKGGDQTALLAQQLAAMPAGGTVVLTVPAAPYRCPPGPYERACLIADWLRQRKPQSKLVVLDANANFTAEADNFAAAFRMHGIEYVANAPIDHVDQGSKTVFTAMGAFRGDVVNLIPRQRAGALVARAGLANATGGRFAGVDVLSYASQIAPKVHVVGDSSATTQPKAGHIANQEAKVCADAIVRILGGGTPDPAPVTTSACYSTITMSQASWLHALFQYDAASRTMVAVPAATGASSGWSADHFDDMNEWFRALMADSFA